MSFWPHSSHLMENGCLKLSIRPAPRPISLQFLYAPMHRMGITHTYCMER